MSPESERLRALLKRKLEARSEPLVYRDLVPPPKKGIAPTDETNHIPSEKEANSMALTNAERQARWREKHQEINTNNAVVTTENNAVTEARIEVLPPPRPIKQVLLNSEARRGLIICGGGLLLFGLNMVQTLVLWTEKGGVLATILGPISGALNFVGLASLGDLYRRGVGAAILLALAVWLAFAATDIYGTYRFFSTRFGDNDATRTWTIKERERLQGIIATPLQAPSDAARKAAGEAVRSAAEEP